MNGKQAKIISVGQSYEGVKLLEANTHHAVVELEGQRRTLTLNSTVLLSKSLGAQAAATATSAQIFANENGFFMADGRINGETLEFLVDTGANLVVLSSRHADQVDLEYEDGIQGYATTASGNAPMYKIELDRISFKGIELRNVEAGVIVGNFPVIPLLGMSFLNKLEMNRSGNRMVLRKR